MCGRFTIIAQEEILEKRFSFAQKFRPRYNAAPSQRLPGDAQLRSPSNPPPQMGLNPPWLKQLAKKDGLINAKAETLKEKPTFKADLEKRRCLVLADSFYEWKRTAGGKKAPYRSSPQESTAFRLRGHLGAR